METIRKQLEKLSRGHVAIMWGLCVMRVGETFLVGETINIRHERVTFDEATKQIFDLTRQ